jgi:hypothetical protein
MFFWRDAVYKPVASLSGRDSQSESDDDESKSFLGAAHTKDTARTKNSTRILLGLTALNVCVLLLSCVLFARSTWLYHRASGLNVKYRQVLPWSPVLDRFDLEPTTKRINGSFYPSRDGGSIARQQPNPDDDAIWDEWELTRVYPVTRAELGKMGVNWTTAAKLEDDTWGLGDDAYAAIFDVYHQVHCLNSLRHIAYGGYCGLLYLPILLNDLMTDEMGFR